MRISVHLLAIPLTCSFLSMHLDAAPIQAGSATYEYSNTFVSRLFPGTPFNPGSVALDVPVESEGVFVIEWGNQSGDTIPFELTSAVADGALPGDPPIPFQILAGVHAVPQLGSFTGTYSNVIQDTSDPGFATGNPSSLASADAEVGGPFAQVLIDGTTLYTTPYTLTSFIAGLPYPVGTEFIGINDSEVRVQLGATPDPSTDPVIGMALAGGVVRVNRVVPEPSGIALVLILAVAAGWSRRASRFCHVES